MIKNKVGIVIVSYNAHKAVELTLASLSKAKNETEYKVVLVDNASKLAEQKLIKSSFDRYALGSTDWTFIQEERNSGFSGGNNIGIKQLLDDPEINQICLLNSDVIVTDHWLDRLIEKNEDAVSAVTNKADSEQCIPCDYDFSLEETLEKDDVGLKESVYQTINKFANKRYGDFQGSIVNSDVTFFCVLLRKSVIEKVGLLDETFFPGGYEDDDYCLRLKSESIEPKLCRDVFIHHWGSASFGQLQQSYFQEKADKNRSYLEEKHGIQWAYRAERPFLSYFQDVLYCYNNRNKIKQFEFYDKKFVSNLDNLVSNYVSESKAICKLHRSALGDSTNKNVNFDSIQEHWNELKEDKDAILESVSENRFSAFNSKYTKFLADLNLCQLTTINQYKYLCEHAPDVISGKTFEEIKISFVDKIKKAIKTIVNFKGTVFFAGYPYHERLNDGYFQRIKAIDEQASDGWRVYVDHNQDGPWWSLPVKQVLAINVAGGFKNKLLARMLTILMVLRSRKIYFHSVLRMHDSRFGYFMYFPFVKKIIDIHGVVPEEFRYHNDYFSACLYENYEKIAVKHADVVLTVTDTMKQYLADKYRVNLTQKGVTLPIFQDTDVHLATKSSDTELPKVIYAGGLHKWQQVDKMISAIEAKKKDFKFFFFTPSPDIINGKLSLDAVSSNNIEVGCKTTDELKSYYQMADYGFILREDIIVNNVSCPTKLIEYLEYNIIPVIDSPNIGDFVKHGMQYVSLNDFLIGKLPGYKERAEIINNNRKVIIALHKDRNTGNSIVSNFINGDGDIFQSTGDAIVIKFATKVKNRLSPNSKLSQVGRKLWNKYKAYSRFEPVEHSVFDLDALSLGDKKYDVVVQVDNFVAGGLENVVIDINTEFEKSNLTCCLVVFGTSGSAVEKARGSGLTVFEMPYDRDIYTEFLKRVQPKVVMTHYSMQGLDVCKQLGIYTIQVIHNMYMWFSDAEKALFAKNSEFTDCYVSVSKIAQDYAISKLSLPEDKCIIIPNGVDLPRFTVSPDASILDALKMSLGIDEDDFIYLSVGSLNHQKNSASLVRSFAKIAQEHTNTKLIMVGPVYEQDIYHEVMSVIAINGLENRVIRVDHDNDISKYYSIADVFVHSPFFEGAPLVILEAIAANLPVVTVETLIPSDLKHLPGIYTVPPHVDLFKFDKRITDLRSSQDVEQKFADSMTKIYEQYKRPNAENELANYDKSVMFKKYIDLVKAHF